jgi:hypothetical protein
MDRWAAVRRRHQITFSNFEDLRRELLRAPCNQVTGARKWLFKSALIQDPLEASATLSNSCNAIYHID